MSEVDDTNQFSRKGAGVFSFATRLEVAHDVRLEAVDVRQLCREGTFSYAAV